jgi:hypothetical protein
MEAQRLIKSFRALWKGFVDVRPLQHVGGGTYIVAEEPCLRLRDGEYDGCIGVIGWDYGQCGMDEWIWHACLQCVIDGNCGLAG